MKLKTILLVAFALVTFSVSSSMAQGRFSAGLELGLPVGDLSDVVGIGFGLSGRYEAPINDNLSWMAGLGFLSFGEKDNSTYKVSIIPVSGGVKYYFDGESFSGFYGGAELSINFVKSKWETGLGDADHSSTEIGFAPQIGYHLANIDVALRYAIVSEADYLGIRVAYVFGE